MLPRRVRELARRIFGPEDHALFVVLLEKRPKWILLLVHLYNKTVLNMSSAARDVGLKYESLKRAVRYLAGVSAGRSGIPVSSTSIRPFIRVEEISKRDKFLMLTERGESFAESVINFVNEVVREYGRTDITRQGMSPTTVRAAIASKLKSRGFNIEDYDVNTIILEDELLKRISVSAPLLLSIIKPEAYDLYGIQRITIDTPKGEKAFLVTVKRRW